ncbi:MAG: NAD(P)-binding protein, partial [Nanoarchaeota archaeon]|nr:NAD(P)-binding protein [Nanoarchaeota archaeon]
MKKATILGAGISGLYTASKLTPHYQIEVLEKKDTIGGVTASFKYKDKYILDHGPHKFYTQLPGIEKEFKHLIGKEYLRVKKKNSIRLKGKYYEFPVKIIQLVLGIGPVMGAKIAGSLGIF